MKEGSRSLLRADREARVAGSSQVESCKSDLLFLDSGQAEWQTQTKRHECRSGRSGLMGCILKYGDPDREGDSAKEMLRLLCHSFAVDI